MKKYPFSPAILDALPEELAELFRGLEDTLLDEICSRLALKDQLNEVTVQAIRALRSHGIDTKDIEKAIRKTAGISEKKLNELFDDVIARNQKYYTELIDLAHITQPETLVSVEDTWAIYEQTKQTLRNITRSMGFLVDAGRTMLSPAKAYQWALDSAVMKIQSGAISYNQAIKSAVQQLAGGLKVVNYESGHVDNIDVAVRCTFDGKTYTAYEATQMQRRIERQIRAQKKLRNAYKQAGLSEDATAANIKLQRLNAEYSRFSKAAGLPEQPERLKVLYTDAKSEAAAGAAKAAKPVIRLQKTLDVKSEIVNGIVPKGSEISYIREIAGGNSDKQLRAAKFLSKNYGGEPLQWRKMGGIIQTDNFRYDVHWFERNWEHFEEKLKGVKKK